MTEEREDWVKGMLQQTKTDVAAESLRIQHDEGMPKDQADKIAHSRVLMAMQVRAKILDEVVKATRSEGYQEMSISEKMTTLEEVIQAHGTKVLYEMVTPIERLVNESITTIKREFLSRIEQELLREDTPE
jgi:hypothetical protein